MARDFKAEVTEKLAANFPGMEVDFEPIAGGKRLSGLLTWKGFEGLDFVDRQTKIWDFLKQAFDARSTQVSTIITLTPRERDEYSAAANE